MARRIAAALLAAALAGCGGGIWFGFGGDGDDPPSVSLAASAAAARSGDVVRLVAAASDDFAVVQVAFYRLEPGGSALLLGSDTRAPYELDVLMPSTDASVVQFFARATDDRRQSADSAVVSVTVIR